MIKFERTSVMNFENAMRGARNPLNSWGRMDSSYDEDGNFVFGPNDLDLAKRLRRRRRYSRFSFCPPFNRHTPKSILFFESLL